MQVHRITVWLCLVPVAALTLSQQAPGQVSKPTVCREGCKFSDLNAALKATPPNGVISVAPGTYNACGVVDKPLHLIGLKDDFGRRAHLAGAACQGKGALVLKASDIIIEGLKFPALPFRQKTALASELTLKLEISRSEICIATIARTVFWGVPKREV